MRKQDLMRVASEFPFHCDICFDGDGRGCVGAGVASSAILKPSFHTSLMFAITERFCSFAALSRFPQTKLTAISNIPGNLRAYGFFHYFDRLHRQAAALSAATYLSPPPASAFSVLDHTPASHLGAPIAASSATYPPYSLCTYSASLC